MLLQHLGRTPLALVFLLFLAACGKDKAPDHTKYIPSDAAMVYAMDIKSITEQIGKEKLLDLSLFSDMMDMDEKNREQMEKIQNSGIDLQSTFYVYVNASVVKSAQADMKNGAKMIFLIEDPAKFKKTLSEEMEGLEEGNAEGIEFLQNEDLIIGWKDKVGIAILNPAQAKADLQSAFKVEQPLSAQESKFKDLMNSAFDISMWVNAQPLADQAGSDLPVQSKELGQAKFIMKGFFKKGSIDFEGLTYFPEDMEMNTVFSGGVSDEFMERIQEEEPLALLSLNLDTKALHAYLKKENMLETLSQQIKMMGMNTEEFFDMLSGELAISVNEEGASSGLPFGVYGQLGIANEERFDTVSQQMTAMGSQAGADVQENYMVFNGFNVVPSKDILVVTNNDKQREAFLKDEKGKMPEQIAEKSGSSAFYFYMDIQKLAKAADKLPMNVPEAGKKTAEDKFKEMYFRLEPAQGNEYAFSGSVTLSDDSQNSLMVIMDSMKEKDEAAN